MKWKTQKFGEKSFSGFKTSASSSRLLPPGAGPLPAPLIYREQSATCLLWPEAVGGTALCCLDPPAAGRAEAPWLAAVSQGTWPRG